MHTAFPADWIKLVLYLCLKIPVRTEQQVCVRDKIVYEQSTGVCVCIWEDKGIVREEDENFDSQSVSPV